MLCLELFSQNNPPVLNATDDQVFCPGSAIKIAPSFTITPSPGDPGISSFSIQISSGYQLNFDKLELNVGGPYTTIDTPDWSPSEGKLTLTTPVGVVFLSYGELETAVKNVIFSTTATTITPEKKFSLTFGDANYLPKTDHFYQYIEDIGITWTAARAEAATRTYYGRTGYLATLLSQEEADFAGKQAAGAGWIGGSDASTPDDWKWVTGPETGTTFWQGNANGFSPNGFAFWNNGNGSNEPNNYNNSGEDYVHITAPGVGTDGSWNDLTNTGDATGDYQPKGYIVEYGVPGDPPLDIVATTRIYLTPNPTIATLINPICSGDNAVFTIIGMANSTVSYTTDNGLTTQTVILDGSGQGTATVSAAMANTTIKLTSIDYGSCTSPLTNSATVTINPTPAITSLTSNGAVCVGTDATFTINGTANSTVSYTTDNGLTNQTVILDGSGQGTATVSAAMVDTKIKLTSINNNGCISSLTNSTTVTISASPDFDLAQNTYILCKDVGTITLKTLNPLENNYTYEWKKDGTTLSSVLDSIVTNSSGNYTVKAFSITGSGCESSEKSIEVLGSEEATITNNNLLITDDSNNNSLQILTSNIGDGDYEFVLDDASGSYTDSSFFENIATGMHTLYARDKNGCGGIATYEFFVLAYPKFFTPNGDGKNDIWKIEGADDGSFTVADISIYNRFGVLLFQSDASNFGWDGLSKGKILPSNTYWFKVILKGINGRKIEKTGRVSLMRK